MADDSRQLPFTAPMPETTEILTWDEIRARFPNRWVAVIDFEVEGSAGQFVKCGRVAGHSDNPFKLRPRTKSWLVGLEPEPPGPRVTHEFTGTVYTYPHGTLTCYFDRNSTPKTS